MLINFQNNLPRDGVDFLSFEISKSGSICYYFFYYVSSCPSLGYKNTEELPAADLCPASCKGLE